MRTAVFKVERGVYDFNLRCEEFFGFIFEGFRDVDDDSEEGDSFSAVFVDCDSVLVRLRGSFPWLGIFLFQTL